ncbi:nicotinate (nicotinamide) nucleotide adenylyltransferase [candidate division KSB1 bacterium]|nr:nicotinate (nicotinamide) nucleotide adenylyltransferase [candidate division KSB1 bacterium]
MKIGLYGGTFDPIHNGHLIIAEWTYEALDLDEIIFIPAFIPPNKQESGISSAEIRMDMLKLAVNSNPHFSVSDYEIQKADISYTLQTVCHFREQLNLSRDELFFLIGTDSLNEFHEWHKPDEILQNCTMVVYPRLSSSDCTHPSVENLVILQAPIIGISSTIIRQRVSQHRSIKYMVSESVSEYISQHRLYEKIT